MAIPLRGDVRTIAADFKSRRQAWPVVHHAPGLDIYWRGPSARSFGELVQVGPIDAGVKKRVVRLEIRLTDVMDQVVFLLRNQPGLRCHLAEAVSECAIHVVGVATVLERRGGKSRRGRQRARPLFCSVTVRADTVVNRLTALKRFSSEVGDQSGDGRDPARNQVTEVPEEPGRVAAIVPARDHVRRSP